VQVRKVRLMQKSERIILANINDAEDSPDRRRAAQQGRPALIIISFPSTVWRRPGRALICFNPRGVLHPQNRRNSSPTPSVRLHIFVLQHLLDRTIAPRAFLEDL
jgi:hypothetical protein